MLHVEKQYLLLRHHGFFFWKMLQRLRLHREKRQIWVTNGRTCARVCVCRAWKTSFFHLFHCFRSRVSWSVCPSVLFALVFHFSVSNKFLSLYHRAAVKHPSSSSEKAAFSGRRIAIFYYELCNITYILPFKKLKTKNIFWKKLFYGRHQRHTIRRYHPRWYC